MIPFAQIDTLFLDAGNTLVSMDFDWVARELGALGVDSDAASIRRAEAAARPAVSALASRARPGDDLFERSLILLLERLGAAGSLELAARAALAAALAARIKHPGRDYRLWSWPMPGAEQALARFRALGLRLVVVSNSDGSVERLMREHGFAPHLAMTFDSHRVGIEKPDPRLFELALAKSGAEPERTAHVGDMYYQDVQGSRKAGLHSVLLDPFGDWEVNDCLRCRDLTELAAAFERASR